MVPTLATIVNPPSDEAGSLAPVANPGHSFDAGTVPLTAPLESAPWMDKGKKPAEEGF